MFMLGLIRCPGISEEETMRFTKILSVCLGLVFIWGLQANGNSGASGTGDRLHKTRLLADGGDPLPPPPLMADGGDPLPPLPPANRFAA